MKKPNAILAVAFFVLLNAILSAKVDQIRFGSTGDPLNGRTVTWRGDYTNCLIKWGYTENLEQGETDIKGRTAFGSHLDRLFDYTFPPLQPKKTIYYSFQEYNDRYQECQCRLPWTRIHPFKTSQSTDTGRFTFIAGGDSRGSDTEMKPWGMVASALAKTDAEFYLFVGDLALMGGEGRMWESWFAEGEEFVSQKLIYHSIGNHETYGDPLGRNFVDQLALPENGNFSEYYYSFEYGNAVFISLCTEYDPDTNRGKYFNAQQTQWLAEQLIKYRGRRRSPSYKEWVIVFFHRPFFTMDKHMGEMTGGPIRNHGAEERYPDLSRTWWLDLFDTYGVDVIINGHTHAYMRSKGINLRKTAPGGKDLRMVDGMPETPGLDIAYGNHKKQGRMQIISGGYGAPLLSDVQLRHKAQWYVAIYRQQYHYCEFSIAGKELHLLVKGIPDGAILDEAAIVHQ